MRARRIRIWRAITRRISSPTSSGFASTWVSSDGWCWAGRGAARSRSPMRKRIRVASRRLFCSASRLGAARNSTGAFAAAYRCCSRNSGNGCALRCRLRCAMAISSRRTIGCCAIPTRRYAIKLRWRGVRGSRRRRRGRRRPGCRRDSGILEYALAFARIVTHYVRNYAWLEDGSLLRGAGAIADIPGIMVNGRFDLQAPIGWAYDLKRVWPRARLVIVDDAGHDASSAGITGELVRATDRICLATRIIEHL